MCGTAGIAAGTGLELSGFDGDLFPLGSGGDCSRCQSRAMSIAVGDCSFLGPQADRLCAIGTVS